MALAAAMDFWLAGATLAGPPARAAALHVVDGRIAGKAKAPPKGAHVVDATGLYVAPAVVDAHVHLSVAGDLADVAKRSLDGGVAAVLDLGEPERLLSALGKLGSLRVKFAGPLLTAPGGYPTQSWGKDGYGLEVADADGARAAVRRLAALGATFAKLSFDARYPVLSPSAARAAADVAHSRGLRVAAHALDAAAVRLALDAGADVLAHTPAGPLPDALVREVGARRLWVVSTLHAFGATRALVDNLRRLRAAGARVAYGTDLGNEGTAPGVDAEELRLLAAAGFTPSEVAALATEAAAELVGVPELGRLTPGAAASLLALSRDPETDALALAHPVWVMIDGVRRAASRSDLPGAAAPERK